MSRSPKRREKLEASQEGQSPRQARSPDVKGLEGAIATTGPDGQDSDKAVATKTSRQSQG